MVEAKRISFEDIRKGSCGRGGERASEWKVKVLQHQKLAIWESATRRSICVGPIKVVYTHCRSCPMLWLILGVRQASAAQAASRL